ncbi:hypothetical protein FEP14_03020 [Burkholderia multivorans]|nr:hypothetical protein [Burkholderia multivorans]
MLDADLALEADAATLIAACGAALGRPACAVFVSACAGADDAQTIDGATLAAALARNVTAPLALAPKVRVAALVRGRAPHADDIAAAACYLANAPGVTGATLTVDGGEHLVPPADGPNE